MMMTFARCPRCGCGPDDIELVTKPVERSGKLVGWELTGLRCIGCGTVLGEPEQLADASVERRD
jgi:hypothetical protein